MMLSDSQNSPVAIIGGGLAGAECALALARTYTDVTLFEMKPEKMSPAHTSASLAELVCSNSFRSDEPEAAVGLLKQEMRALNSITLEAAEATRVPAGKALAVDRELFAAYVTNAIEAHPRIRVVRQEITSLEDSQLQGHSPLIITAGPLASEALSEHLALLLGEKHLYFYDAIAPIIDAASVNLNKAFWGSRYADPDPEDKDYLNCPLNEEEYHCFRQALLNGEKIPARSFEQEKHFEACMPVETLASRGDMTLAFGPLKPVGLTDPRTGLRPFAVLQLRAENRERTAFNLVGCQTKLTYPEQQRIFRMIPGLEEAEFLRFGSLHRNTYVNAPGVLTELELKTRPGVFLAGQISGVEGYVESAACGLWLGLALAARCRELPLETPPQTSAIGALLSHLRTETKHFQPSNVNFGLMPALKQRAPKRKRKELYAQRTRQSFADWYERNKSTLQQIQAASS